MKILSLFDGISCGRIALERTGIPVEKYYASEIDKYAEKISESNYPDIIRLGDVTKWREWDIEQPDLICAGSPCQGFSFAGKQLNFSDPRSSLFFEFVNILNHYKPKYFLLENVKMKKEYQDIISKLVGCEPIEINSALVSAQNRRRNYWTNIPNVKQPNDLNVKLSDIIKGAKCSYLVPRGNNKGGFRAVDGKIGTVTSSSWEHNNFVIYTKKNIKKPNQNKSGCLTGGANSGGNHSQMDVIVFDDVEIPLLPSGRIDIHKSDNVRRYTVNECEQFQTLPIDYTDHVSNSQRYKAIGNGWTVDVIAHIFKNMK